MRDSYIVQDLFMLKTKTIVKSDVKPLTCYVCKKELNGVSITAVQRDGEVVFLCSGHYINP